MSYWSWARCLTAVIGKTLSKQAIFGRMTCAWVNTVKALLQEVLAQQASRKIKGHLYTHFKNVWLQDSTTLHLPDVLVEKFKGNVSRGQTKSVAKLNVIMNAISGLCPVMEWNSFTTNEQHLSKSILAIAKAGDLVIRDLGYFVLSVLGQLVEANIYFLSRLRYGVKLFDPHSKQPINLSKLLGGKQWIDKEVICGKDNAVRVRLVAIKLAPQQAAQRRRKAKHDRDRRLNHSPNYYQLLDYVIFITNVESKKWNYQQVAEAYRIRWNIEILFKSWKSGFQVEQLVPEARCKTERVESILYLMLIYIAWFQMLLYAPLRWSIYEKTKKHLSIIKMAKLIRSKSLDCLTLQIPITLKKEISYHCCYDMRQDRLNEELRLIHFFNPLA